MADPLPNNPATTSPAASAGTKPEALLVIDDNDAFRRVLASGLTAAGKRVITAADSRQAFAQIIEHAPAEVLLDLRLGEESGLLLLPEILRALQQARGDNTARVVLLTGYASIATAVEAVKAGAHNYVAKPASVEHILAALGDADLPVATALTAAEPARMSVRRLEWEHIQRVLAAHNGNISATARALGMHRRSLQRKLAKKPMAH